MTDCACGDSWKFVACDLRTGRERAVLHPIQVSFGGALNAVGQGSLTLPTRAVKTRDVWPHLTSVYMLRIAGGDATPENPVVEFSGMVNAFEADSGGTSTVGLLSLDGYLDFRHIREQLIFTSASQTELAAELVNYARPNGIPLEGISAPSQFPRDRTYESWDRKNLGEALRELTEVINGPDWEFFYERSPEGEWLTRMAFRDYVGSERDVLIQSDIESSTYSLVVDGEEHATVVDGLGSGEDEEKLIATAEDDSGIYPQFDAAPSWSDVTRESTLQEHTDGYLEEHREPFAVPGFSVVGLDLDPKQTRLGDTIGVHVNFGAISYHGDARIHSVSWSMDADSPTTRDFEVVPLQRPSDTILNAEPGTVCNDCGRTQ